MSRYMLLWISDREAREGGGEAQAAETRRRALISQCLGEASTDSSGNSRRSKSSSSRGRGSGKDVDGGSRCGRGERVWGASARRMVVGRGSREGP